MFLVFPPMAMAIMMAKARALAIARAMAMARAMVKAMAKAATDARANVKAKSANCPEPIPVFISASPKSILDWARTVFGLKITFDKDNTKDSI